MSIMHDEYRLSRGKHANAADGRCAMEWVAYLAGEKHSDSPLCVSPVLRRFGVALNDRLNDTDRQCLRPYLARCIGTAGDGRDPERIELVTRFVLRDSLPRLLDDAGCQEAAQRVRNLPLDLTISHVTETLIDVRDVAGEACQRAHWRLSENVRKRWYDAHVYADAHVYSAAAYAAVDAAASAVAYADAVDAAASAAAAVYAAYAAALPSATSSYVSCRQAADAALAPRSAEALACALSLFDSLLPTELIQLPAVEDAAAVCGLPELAA